MSLCLEVEGGREVTDEAVLLLAMKDAMRQISQLTYQEYEPKKHGQHWAEIHDIASRSMRNIE